MKLALSILLLTLLLISANACIRQGAGIADSTSPITCNDTVTEIGPAKGSAFGVILLGLIPLSEPDMSSQAIKRALASSNADALTEVTMDNEMCMVPFLSIYRTEVKGNAVKIEKGTSRK